MAAEVRPQVYNRYFCGNVYFTVNILSATVLIVAQTDENAIIFKKESVKIRRNTD